MFEEKRIHRKWFWRAFPMVPCLHLLMHGIASGQGGHIRIPEKFGIPLDIPIWGIWLAFPLTTAFFWFFYKNLARQAVEERLKRIAHIDSSLPALAKQQSWTKLEARIHLLSKELKKYDIKLLNAWFDHQRQYYKEDLIRQEFQNRPDSDS